VPAEVAGGSRVAAGSPSPSRRRVFIQWLALSVGRKSFHTNVACGGHRMKFVHSGFC
jgi:hypothetical protein